MFCTTSYEKESNLMATEWRKVMVNLHRAEKIINHFYIYYVLEKHFETGFASILSAKKFNKL